MPDSLDLIDPFDECPWLLARDLFRRLGFEPLPPCAIDDFQLRGRLWEFIYALAARRFYLHNTNLLSDRQVYIWLYDQWLNHEVADIPPKAEWNCHANPAEYEPEGGTMTWLRYYADEETRNKWSIDFPDDEVPEHEDPPYDRDRWLPEPPIPLQPVEFDESETELLEGESESGDPDPLGLEAVDAQIAAHHDAEELAAITGGEQPEGWQRPIDKLQRTTGTLLPPDELTDETLTAKLWELLHNLACHGFYVQHTNHLSDRQLYAELWRHGLR